MCGRRAAEAPALAASLSAGLCVNLHYIDICFASMSTGCGDIS
ncbi:hypothetical protein [Azospirillum palustre]